MNGSIDCIEELHEEEADAFDIVPKEGDFGNSNRNTWSPNADVADEEAEAREILMKVGKIEDIKAKGETKDKEDSDLRLSKSSEKIAKLIHDRMTPEFKLSSLDKDMDDFYVRRTQR